MTTVPESFKPWVRFLNVANAFEKLSMSAALILRQSFANFARDLAEEGNLSQEDNDWLDDFDAQLPEITNDDVTAARQFADQTFARLQSQFDSGVRRKSMPSQFFMLSTIYSVFDDEDAAEKEKKCRIVAAKIKRHLENADAVSSTQNQAEEQPSVPPPQPTGFQQYPQSNPSYVPPDVPAYQPSPPEIPQQQPQTPSYTPPTPPPEEPAPKPAPAPMPAPEPRKPVMSVPGCTYDRGPALEYFQKEGIQLVTKVYPEPDDLCKKAILRYLDYSISRLYADEYTQPYAFVTNALKTWKTGKPE